MGFSVLMSVYAKEKPEYLAECLQSLALQTLQANEVILVEDGPISSALASVIDSFRKSLNIVSVRLLQNVGLAGALNAGLKSCTHELVARMDTDDVAMPKRFEKQVAQFSANPNVGVLGAYAQDFDDKASLGSIRIMPITHQAIFDNLFSCPFIHPSVMYKKDLILSIGGYDETLKRRQDYDLWFRCAKNNMKFGNIPEVLLKYRFTEETHSRQSKKVLWSQGVIGFKGVIALNQPAWKGVGAFFPLCRSFLPGKLEHLFYKLFKCFDPRQGSGKS